MTENSSSPSSCCPSAPWIGYLFFLVILAGILVLGVLLLSVTERRAEAVKRGIILEIKPAEMDAAVWGRNFPHQYDSWKRTQETSFVTKHGGARHRDYLRGTSEYAILFAGYGFGKEYNQARVHWYSVEDVAKSLRINEGSPAACWQCKSPDAARLIVEMGVEAFSAKKFNELKDEVTHTISCYDCHDETTLALRSVRSSVLEGFKSSGKNMD